jgi:hypothetical protein
MSEPTISSEFARKRLDNRRSSETPSFCCGNFHYVATVSFFSRWLARGDFPRQRQGRVRQR